LLPCSWATGLQLGDGAIYVATSAVGDMLARARAAGSDATLLGIAWAHLQTREARLARENPAT
jgi:hypothetical protein